MRKFLALAIGVVLALHTSAAFAATTATQTMEPTIQTLLAFNKWLYGNNFYGANYVNDNLAQAYDLAQKWDDHAMLSFVDVSFQQPDQAGCSFEFGSVNKPHEVYKAECVNVNKNEKVTGQAVQVSKTVTAASLFGSPTMKLRKFVSDIIGSPTILNQVRGYMNGSSQANVDFTLVKGNGNFLWSWGISDGRELGMNVHADASQLNSTLVFEGQ